MIEQLHNQERFRGKSTAMHYVVAAALARGQQLIVGTSNHQERYNQLKALFPNAELEIMDLGVRIWKKK